MPRLLFGAHVFQTRWLVCSGALLVLLCRCTVYDTSQVSRGQEGVVSAGSGGGSNTSSGAGGNGVSGDLAAILDAGAVFPTADSAGVMVGSGGAGGTSGSDPDSGDITGSGGNGGASGATGAGGAAGGNCAGTGLTDLPIFANGTFVNGWGTVGSFKTCNGTPANATVSTITALAIDLSCNSFNGALVINWNSPVSCAYVNLSFDIYFNDLADITALKVYLQGTQGPTGLLLDVTSLLKSPQAKAFNHVSLPLSSFGSGLTYNGVGYFNGSAGGIPLFYVNNVVLGVTSPADASVD